MFNLTEEEKYIYEAIIGARTIQEFLWGQHNKGWDIEEWKRMFRKRIAKIDNIDINNPHAKIELKKRLLQNACLCIALMNNLDKDQITEKCDTPSNLPEYSK